MSMDAVLGSLVTHVLPICITLGTFTYLIVRKANEEYVKQLEARLLVVERECARCTEERTTLERDNRALLLEIVRLSGLLRIATHGAESS